MGNCFWHLLCAGPGAADALLDAVCTRQLPRVRHLVKNVGVDVDNRFPCGGTVLHYAANIGAFDIVSFLVLEAGADVNVQSIAGYTALMEAVFNDDLQMVRLLVEHGGADPDLKTRDGCTALLCAMQASPAQDHHLDIVTFLASCSNVNDAVYAFCDRSTARESWLVVCRKRQRMAFLQGDLEQNTPHPLFGHRLFDRNILNEIFQYM